MQKLESKGIAEKARPIKVAEPIHKTRQPVQAIRVTFAEFMKELNSTVERGEGPYLLIKHSIREKTNIHEIEMVFLGRRHVELLRYFKKHPSKWKSFGNIVLGLEEAAELALRIIKVIYGISLNQSISFEDAIKLEPKIKDIRAMMAKVEERRRKKTKPKVKFVFKLLR